MKIIRLREGIRYLSYEVHYILKLDIKRTYMYNKKYNYISKITDGTISVEIISMDTLEKVIKK